MKRKGPPYKVVRGQLGETPPPYVEAVFKDYFTLSGDTDQMHENLKKAGLISSLKKDLLFRPCFKFQYLPRPNAENAEIQKLFVALNAVGFKFAYDYKSPDSPSGIMTELQDMNVLDAPFDEISWSNPREWQITTYEVENT